MHLMTTLDEYTSNLFAPEDAVLRELQAVMSQRNFPIININALEGRLLQVLLHSIAARKVLEIGSLAGYSGIWLARALPVGGKLITLELNPQHAAVAREFYAKAGVGDKVELREGAALDLLPELQAEAPFDAVFIDADKPNQVAYLDYAIKLVRAGGLILVDNCYRHGDILDRSNNQPDVTSVRQANQQLASDPRLFATILPTSDGLAVAVVKANSSEQAQSS